MEGTRSLSDLSSLLNESFEDLRVTVTLVFRRVTAQEIKILTSGHIPHIDSFTSSECDGERLIVVSAILHIEFDVSILYV
jgi:hypothetical protein